MPYIEKPKPKGDDRGGDRIVAKAKPKLLPAVSSRMQQGSTVAPPVVKPAAKPLPKGYGRAQPAPPPPKPSFQYGGNAEMLAKTKAWTPLQGLQGGKKPALPLPKGSKAQTSSQAKAEAKVAGYTPAPYGGNANAPATKAWTPSQGVQGGKEEFKYSPFVPPSPAGLDLTKLKPTVPGQINLSDTKFPTTKKGAESYMDMAYAFAKGGREAVSNMSNPNGMQISSVTGLPFLSGLGSPDTQRNYASRDQEPIREAALQRLAAQDDYLTEMDYMSPDEMVSQVGQAFAEVGTGAATGALLGLPFGPVGIGVGATIGTVGGIVVAGYDLLNSGELDPRKYERQTVVDERNRMLGLPDRLDPSRRIGGLLSGTGSFGPSVDRLLYGIPANELKGDNFPGPVGTLSTYFPQRDNPQFPPPATPLPSTGMTPADLIAWAKSIRSQVGTKTGFSGKLEDPATAPNPAYVPKPPAAATTPAPIVPPGPPAAPAAPAPEPGGGDSGDGMSEFEKLAQLMEVGKYARQPVAEDRTRENELYNMLQESQNQMQALQQQYIEALIKQLNTQPQMGIPAPVGPGAPAAAAGNMYSLGNIPRVAATGSNLQFSNAGLGYLNSIDPSLLQALMQYLKAMNYTGQGQMGSFGEMNYARQGGLGSLLQSDASFENPLAYAGLTPQMREPAEAGLRSLFAQMGLMG